MATIAAPPVMRDRATRPCRWGAYLLDSEPDDATPEYFADFMRHVFPRCARLLQRSNLWPAVLTCGSVWIMSGSTRPLHAGPDRDRSPLRRLGVLRSGRTRPLGGAAPSLPPSSGCSRTAKPDFAEALRLDLNKSRYESFLSETSFVIEEAKFARRHLARWMRQSCPHADDGTAWSNEDRSGRRAC